MTPAQRIARETFDLDAAVAALPPHGPSTAPPPNHRGAAGVRLRGHLKADISDPLLRELACDTLGAKRCSEQYLDALRVVLGNQADAERYRYVLEMNRRVSFAPANVMRQIIGQMRSAGITFGSPVLLGSGRSQVVQCYWRDPKALTDSTTREEAFDRLERMYRATEAANDARRQKAGIEATCASTDLPWLTITDADVPY